MVAARVINQRQYGVTHAPADIEALQSAARTELERGLPPTELALLTIGRFEQNALSKRTCAR